MHSYSFAEPHPVLLTAQLQLAALTNAFILRCRQPYVQHLTPIVNDIATLTVAEYLLLLAPRRGPRKSRSTIPASPRPPPSLAHPATVSYTDSTWPSNASPSPSTCILHIVTHHHYCRISRPARASLVASVYPQPPPPHHDASGVLSPSDKARPFPRRLHRHDQLRQVPRFLSRLGKSMEHPAR